MRWWTLTHGSWHCRTVAIIKDHEMNHHHRGGCSLHGKWRSSSFSSRRCHFTHVCVFKIWTFPLLALLTNERRCIGGIRRNASASVNMDDWEMAVPSLNTIIAVVFVVIILVRDWGGHHHRHWLSRCETTIVIVMENSSQQLHLYFMHWGSRAQCQKPKNQAIGTRYQSIYGNRVALVDSEMTAINCKKTHSLSSGIWSGAKSTTLV